MKLIYVAHPLGAEVDREENRSKASRWVAFVGELGYAPVADWIILSGQWDETHRHRGLAIDFALIQRCDEVWLFGPRVSPGMQLEKEYAQTHGIITRNFTDKTPEAIRMHLEKIRSGGVDPFATEMS